MTCGILGGKNSLSQGLLEVSPISSFAALHLHKAGASIPYRRRAINRLNRHSYEISSGQQGPQVPAEFSDQVGHLMSPAWREKLPDEDVHPEAPFYVSGSAGERP